MSTDAADLMARAEQAAMIRAHQTHPAVVALTVERTRIGIERATWVGIGLGLIFTMVTVQQFGAGSAAPWSLPWLAAWLLAPLVEIPLLAILRGEQVMGRYDITPGPWVRRVRWFLLAVTYLLNTWTSWAALGAGVGGWREVVLHSAPPLVVLAAAEALTDLREGLARAIAAAGRAPTARPTPRPRPAAPPVQPPSPTKPVAPPGRRLRDIGVDWALDHWDDPTGARGPLRPLHIRDGLMAAGTPVSKGEASKILADAKARRAADGLPVEVEEPDRARDEVSA